MNIKKNIKIVTVQRFKAPKTAYIQEAVLYFNEDEQTEENTSIQNSRQKPNPLKHKYITLGSEKRISTGRLFNKWKTTLSLKEYNPLMLFEQRTENSEVDEVLFYGLGNLVQYAATRSEYFRLESLVDQFRMAGGNIIRQYLKCVKDTIRQRNSVLVIDVSNLNNFIERLIKYGSSSKLSKKYNNKITENTTTTTDLISALIEGIHLGSYSYVRLKSNKSSSKISSLAIEILASEEDSRKTNILDKTSRVNLIQEREIIADGVMRARSLVNDPPNLLTTNDFANLSRKIATSTKTTCKIFTKAQIKSMGMNALLGVNLGSHHEAKLVILEHNKSKSTLQKPTILLIGKGVLFDSGGLSLKPSNAMIDMKMDMAGGAAVLAAFETLARIKTTAHVIAIIPITDNMTGPNALKVGDVLTTYSGKTVEVLNTDAEGRLILCDALSYGIKTYKPDYIVDLATLTGACMVGLGSYYAGLFTSGDEWANQLLNSSRATDEPLWRLPLDEQYLKELQSDIADLKNIGSSYGGATTAAKFLEQFVPKEYRSKWAHLDIAPVMDYNTTKGYQIKGATGFGVRLLVHLVKNLTNTNKKQ